MCSFSGATCTSRVGAYVTMQITFLTRKSALIYRRGLRQRVASLALNCNGDFAIRAHVSPPRVSWPSSFPLPLGIPCQVLSGDAKLRFSQCVTNPTPFPSFYFYFYWQLICLGPQSVVADFV